MGRNSMGRRAAAAVFAALVALQGGGCGDGGVVRACPDGGTAARYEDVGRSFLQVNCNWCHAATVKDRLGAPTDFTFDTLEEVLRHRERILVRATGDRPSMPPGPDKPDAAARQRFGVWLACAPP